MVRWARLRLRPGQGVQTSRVFQWRSAGVQAKTHADGTRVGAIAELPDLPSDRIEKLLGGQS